MDETNEFSLKIYKVETKVWDLILNMVSEGYVKKIQAYAFFTNPVKWVYPWKHFFKNDNRSEIPFPWKKFLKNDNLSEISFPWKNF